MNAPEKYALNINGYGAFTSPDIASISVVLNRLMGYVVEDVILTDDAGHGKSVVYGVCGRKPIIVRWSEESQCWWGAF